MSTGSLAGAAELSQDQQDLVNLLLGEEGIEVGQPQKIFPREGDADTAPLSFAQRRLWFLDRLDPGSPVYNMFGAWEVRGRLDPGVLEASLNEVVRRHESLRTTFTELRGEPVQVIARRAGLPLTVVDLTRIPGATVARRVAELAGTEARRPFDLTRGPLLRATVLRLGEKRSALVVVMHHIVSDGWSVRLFFREASALYEAFSAGGPSPLADLAIQYADFACWQRVQLAGELLEGELAWWKGKLGGEPPALELPTDRPRPARRSAWGASFSFVLPSSLTDEVEALAEQRGVTLFMTFLAAFEALLYRYTGQEAFTVGTPIANRHRAETEDLIGFFVNTLVLGAVLGRETSFAELLGQAREVALAAYDHQDLPFEKLVEELAPKRDRSRTPLFQVMLAMQDVPPATFDLSGLEWSPLDVAGATAKFDLSLLLAASGGRIAGTFEYDGSLFDAATVRRLSRHLEQLLAAAVKAPGVPVASLSYLSRSERHHVLREMNDHRTGAPSELSIPELFEAQAGRTPEAVAAVRGGGGPARISFRELGDRAARLARGLRRRGAGAEDVVGICLGRGPDWAVAVLGVLEAGAAYLPLDPTHPRDRLAFMIEDAAVRAVVTGGVAAAALDGVPVERLPVEATENEPGGGAPRPASALSPAHLAYVVYTSGSTGRPKGVPVTHRNLVQLLLWSREYFGFGEHTRVLQTLSPAFDFGSMELLATLLFGGTLVFPKPGEGADPVAYARAVREHGIDTIHTTPSFFREVVAAGTRFDELGTLHLGGEALNRETVDRLFAALGGRCTIYNGYGPTEATINCAIFTVGRRARRRDARHLRTPIGRASANNRIYVLDRWGRCLPVGVAGELHAAGGGLARGYLRRPRQTAEKFVPDPLTGAASSRLYRTGDLTRLLADGNVEFLGRLDHQVKIRGFRIELGEVEAALAELDGVREAVVVAREAAVVPAQEGTRARLVAYVVPARGSAGSARLTEDLRRSLAVRLPEYMVPSAFVALPELPLNPNGKVDRGALPAPSRERTEVGYRAPRSPLEEWLTDLWSELLEVPHVGIYDNFFELGGHSLLATQVVSRLREVWSAEIALARLFEAPTIAALAAAATAALGEGRRRAPIRPVERGPELPLSFAQERLWFLDQLEPGNPFYNISWALRVRGPLDLGLFQRCLGEVVRRHESLRTCFAQRTGRPFQVIAPALAVPLPLVDVTALPGALGESEARQRTLEELRRPFDLDRLPLLRVMAFKLASEYRLAVTIHHIVSDGWSTGVLTREVVELYREFGAGGESPLPALEVQYADFAAWQRRQLSGDVLEEELDYWRRQLAGVASLELPTDQPRPAVERFRGASRPVGLDPGLTRGLKTLSARCGVTLFMALLAAFKVMLARYSSQRDVAVGSPIANRTAVELEGLIGFFANTLVLRSAPAGRASWRELLAQVREVCLGAYAHQEVPFEKLVAELSPERDMSRSPLFQVMLVLQNQPRSHTGISGLDFEGIPVDTGIAKFDLTVFWWEAGDRLAGTLEYNSDLFDPTTALRIAADYRTLLRSLAADVEAQPERVALLSPAREHQVLHEWNDTRVPALGLRPVHRRVEEQVERTPGAIAVVDGGEPLSYRELDEWANRLAHVLIGTGVGPDRLVGICVERSVEMAVGLLAVLKAGGAAVALDPAYPESRTAAIIRDAGLSVLLVERHLRGCLPAHCATCLELGGGPAAFASESRENPRVPVSLDHPIYAIYTSGSSGEPKGILVTHRAFANLVDWQLALRPSGGERTVQFATFGFCVSFQEIFTSWCSGGTLVLAGEMVRRDVAGLAQFLEAEEIERLHVPFAALKHLAEAAAGQDRLPTRLREVISAGEQLQVSPAVRRLFERLEGCVLRNQYGASETHVVSDLRLAGSPAPWPAIPPVGRPISNVAIYLLDRFLAPVALGVAGALFTSGRCDARGYLDDPAMTAHKFLPHPFAPEPGARLYRTGDLARHLAGGEIEYLGRVDAQVKIRGYRVELGEVEAVLARDARVRDVAVLAHEGAGGGQRLVAYVVLEATTEDGDAGFRALRGALRETLPEYMVPAVFVPMETLPLNANGKLDRDALPVPESVRHARRAAYAAPRNPVEEFVSGLWSEILGVDEVGVHDGFFELGGHSLLATQVISQVRTVLRVDLPLRRLFGAPTVAELAAAIVEEEPVPGQAEKLARLLLRVKSMSAEQAEDLLRGDLKVRAADPGEVAESLSARKGIGGPGA